MILGESASYYFASVLLLLFINVIAAWGFDLQYGTTLVVNLAFLASQAAGAYVAAVLTIGPASPAVGEQYLFGAHLPFPVAWLAGIAAGGLLALVLGLVVVPRLNVNGFAIVTLVIGIGLQTTVASWDPLFTGRPAFQVFGCPSRRPCFLI
jgi:branched-chain amino acid transport system permease protein